MNRDDDVSAAVSWLEAWATLAQQHARYEDTVIGNRPFFTVMDADDTGSPMIVKADDYTDHGRWWL